MKTKVLSLIGLAVSLFLVGEVGAQEPEPREHVVAALKGRRISAEVMSALDKGWVAQLSQDYEVIRPDAAALSAFRACPNTACAVRVLRRVNPSLGLTAELVQVGGSSYLSLKLLDLSTGDIVRQLERTSRSDAMAMVTMLEEATGALFGKPAEAPSPSDRPTLTSAEVAPQGQLTSVVKVENKNKQRALYACVGGAMVAAAGVLVTSSSGDGSTAGLGGTVIGLGVASFVIGGLVYVISPSHHTKVVSVAPLFDGQQAGVKVAGRF